jgi:hypothetical protein
MSIRKSLINQRFGRLVITSFAQSKPTGDGTSIKAFWNAKCDCGNILEVCGNSLLSGNTKSCGCFRDMLHKGNQKVEKLLEDSPLSYYWIGFLMADGHLQENGRLKLCLAIKDKIHLEKFADFISCPIHIYSSKVKCKRNSNCQVSVMDKKWAKLFSKKFDFNHNKTINPPKNLKFINSDLFLSFFIGFVDGDGCINKQWGRQDSILRVKVHSSWQSTLQGWVNMLYSFVDIETKHWVVPQVIINNQGYAQFAIANSDVLRFLKEAAVGLQLPILERKWNRIDLKYTSKYIQSNLLKLQIVKLTKESPLSQKGIAKILGVGESYVSQVIKRGVNRD